MKKSIFIVFALLFWTDVFCMHGKPKNVPKNIIDKLRAREEGCSTLTRSDLSHELIMQTKEGKWLTELFKEDNEDTRVTQILLNDKNHPVVDLVITEFMNVFGAKSLECLFSEIIKHKYCIRFSDKKKLMLKTCLTAHKILGILIKRYNVNPNYTSQYKYSPLHMAAMYRDSDLVNFLLKYGADTSIKDGNGRTAYEAFMNSMQNRDKDLDKEPYKSVNILLKPDQRKRKRE